MTKALSQLGSKGAKNARVRAQAGMVYVADGRGLTLEELHQDTRFAHIPLATLEKWCAADGWVQQRIDFVNQWTAIAKERLGNRLAQDRLEELTLLDSLKATALEKINDGLTQPKSLEGMLKTTLDILKYKDELRQRIGDDVIDRTALDAKRGLPSEDAPAGYTNDELEAAARAALAIRRDKMRNKPDLVLAPETAREKAKTIEVPVHSDANEIEDLADDNLLADEDESDQSSLGDTSMVEQEDDSDSELV